MTSYLSIKQHQLLSNVRLEKYLYFMYDQKNYDVNISKGQYNGFV